MKKYNTRSRVKISFFLTLMLLSSLVIKSQSFDATGLALWVTADSVSKTNNFVDTWYDHSGYNNDGIQLLTGQQPLFIDSIVPLNNKPVLRFDGNDFLSIGDNLDLLNKNWSYFVVSKQTNVGIQTVFAKNDFSGTAGHFGMINLSPDYGLLYRNAVGNQYAKTQTIPDNYFLTEMFLDRTIATNSLYINNAFVNTVDFGADNSISWDNGFSFNIGTNSTANSFFLIGDIAEIIIFDRTLSAQKKSQVETYLRTKYAPPINLGADITIPYGFCDTTLDAGARFTSFLWSTGATTQTINALGGSYWVEATDIFGFISRDTVQISYPSIPKPTGSNVLCLGTTKQWDTGLPKNGYTFEWQDLSTDSIFNITTAGQYWVKVTDTAGCFEFSDTITYTTDNYSQTASLGNDTTLCAGNSISLKSGAGPGVTYVWNDFSTNSTLVVNSTSSYSVTATNGNGCVKKDTIVVTITGTAPTVAFTADTVCLGSNTIFANNSSLPYDSIRWNFGDGNTSITYNATHSYSSFGSFTATLTSYDNVCYNSLSKTVVVKSNPLADFSNNLSCAGNPVVFTNASLAQTSGSIVRDFWNFSGLGNSYAQDTSFIFSSSGAYNVSLEVTSSNGCFDTISKVITVVSSAPLPVISLISPTHKAMITSSNILFSWSNINSTQNTIQLASDSLFSSIFHQSSTSQNQVNLNLPLINNQVVFWRVTGSNYCNEKVTSQVFKFTFLNPSGISGLTLWLASDSVNKIGVYANTWYDQSVSNMQGVQSIPDQQPLFVDSIVQLNNKPVLRFDGDDFFSLGDNLDLLNKNWSYFVVSKQTNAGIQTVFAKNDFSGTAGHFAMVNLSPDYGLLYRNALGNQYAKTQTIPTNYFLTEVFLDRVTATISLYVNNVLANTVSFTSDTSVSWDNTLAFNIGANSTNAYFLNGDIAEILVFNKNLDNQEKLQVQGYIRNKYAPPINLGVDITISDSFCNTTLDAGSRFTSFLWSTGETTQTISINKSGDYWVSAIDVFGFTSTDTIKITYPTISYPKGSTAICMDSSNIWNTGLSKKAFTFLWQDNSTDSLFEINKAGNYFVKITDTTASKCFIKSDIIKFTIDSFSVKATLGTDLSLCEGNKIGLIQGANSSNKYVWNDNSTDSTLIINSPGKYSVIVTNINNCIKKDTINIIIKGKAPTINFSSSKTCIDDSTNFKLSSSLASTWNWDFGDTTTSTKKNPSHKYKISKDYIVKLTVSDGQCSNSLQKTVTVNSKPVPSFLIPDACSNTNINFSNSSTISKGSISKWLWNFGDSNSGTSDTSTEMHGSHNFLSGGTFLVSLTATSDSGCVKNTTQAVPIKQSPAANFSYPITCEGNYITFTDITNTTFPSSSIANWNWNFGDGSPNSINEIGTHLYLGAGTFNVSLTVKASNNCSSSLIKTVSIHEKPKVSFATGSSCLGSPIKFTNTSSIAKGTIKSWKWNFGELGTDSAGSPSFVFADTGFYSIKLQATSLMGCKDSTVKKIHVNVLPKALFTFDPSFGSAPLTVNFISNSIGAASYLWDFGDGASLEASKNPTHTFANNDTFKICLSVTNAFGCISKQCKEIRVIPPQLDIALKDINIVSTTNKLDVSADISNLGTRDIYYFEISVDIGNGTIIQETFNDTLLAGATKTYYFKSSIQTNPYKNPAFVCVTVEKPNNEVEEVLSNNKQCKTLTDEFQVLDLYPNPTSGSMFIQYILPANDFVSIVLYNDKGAMVKELFSGPALKGLNEVKVETQDLRVGIYACRLIYRDKAVLKKMMKL